MSQITHQKINTAESVDDNLDLLPPNFEPSEWDVICQRGKECFEHVGNCRFRAVIDSNLAKYVQARSREEKSFIVSEIVGSFRAISASSKSSSLSGGGFVRKDLWTRRWHRVGDKVARVKAGQALRDVIKTWRAVERKRVHGANQHEKECNFPNVMEPVQHASVDNDRSSLQADYDAGKSSWIDARGFKRRSRGLNMIKNYEDVNRPTHVDSLLPANKGVPILPTDSKTFGSSEGYHASNESPCFNNVVFHPIQHDKEYDPFLLTQWCKPLLESQILSELEPRPILSIHDNKTTAVSKVGTLEQQAPIFLTYPHAFITKRTPPQRENW